MTKDTRHLLTAAYSGLALIFIAGLASAIGTTLDPGGASTGFLAAWGAINVAAWGLGWLTPRPESDSDFGELLIALGDLLLPLNLYMVSFARVTLIAGSVPFSASFAAMVALVYYIFADLAARRVPLTRYPHRAYLFTSCVAVPVYFAHSIFGLSVPVVTLMLVGVAGLATALCRLLDPPLRRHYAVAGLLLVVALVGLRSRSFAQQADGLLLAGVYLVAGLLFVLTWLNREAWLGKLLGFGTWVVLTLAFAATLYFLSLWQPPSLVIAGVWVALLICIWALIRQKPLAPLRESAYWFAWTWGAIVVAFLGPLWRSLVTLHFAGLQTYRFTGASSLTVEMPPHNLWRVLALFLIAVSWVGGIIIKQVKRAPTTHERSWETGVENFLSIIPPLLLLAVVSAAGAGAFGAVSWVVALLVVTGAVYCWAGAQSERAYPSRPLMILGYAALVLAVITASFHLPTTLFTVAAAAIILFIVSEWHQSLTAYVVCLAHLVGGVLLVAFGIFPQRSVLVLALFYLLLLLFAYWWVSRARGAKAPRYVSTRTFITLTESPGDLISEPVTGHVLTKTLITLTLIILLAAFIIAASIYLRQFYPITFLILASTYAVIRYAWESAWQAPARRYAHWLWLVGSELAHVAVGLLLYSTLRFLNVRLDFYGLAFAGLSLIYLIAYLASSREQRPLTRASLMHFAHVFSLLAAILTILYCPLGIKAALTWLLVMAVHLFLSAGEETRWVYPIRALKALGYGAVGVAAIHLLWQSVPGLAVRVPLPEMLAREASTLFQVSFLFALSVIFTIIMNRDKSLGQELLALGLITTALALVALVAAPGSAPLYSGMLYVYLLLLARVELRRTKEETFSPRLPQVSLWLANALLLLLLAISALQRQFDPLALLIVTTGFMALSPGWEQMLPIYVRHRFRLVLLTAYTLAHAAAAVTVYAWLRAYGLILSYYGLAFAALTGMHLLGYWLVQRRRADPLREKFLWFFSHLLALLSLILTLAFASRSLNGALAALLLALMSLVASLLSGRAGYQHFTAYSLIAVIALTGRAWGVPLLEFYLIPVAGYLGWVLHQRRGTEEVEREGKGVWAYGRMGDQVQPPARPHPHTPTPPHPHMILRVGLTAGIFLILIGYPAWRFTTTGGLIHLIVSGLGAVAAIHLFVITRVHPWLIYLIGLVLIFEAVYIIGARQFDPPKVASLIAIGVLIIADLGYLARRKPVKDRDGGIEG